MWLCFCLILSFCVAGGLACDCQIANRTVQTCSATTDELLEYENVETILTEDCMIRTTGANNIRIPVNSVELNITGEMRDFNYSLWFPNLCRSLQNAEERGSVQRNINIFDVPKCEEMGSKRNNVREARLHDRHHKIVHRPGSFRTVIGYSNINGDPEKSVCLEIKGEITCDNIQQ